MVAGWVPSTIQAHVQPQGEGEHPWGMSPLPLGSWLRGCPHCPTSHELVETPMLPHVQ